MIKLYTFPGSNPVPVGPLAVDAAGDLFGVTESGGSGFGQVFELTPGPKGLQESTLYSFAGGGAGDGDSPSGGLIFDSAGNLYGVTKAGGSLAGNCSPYGCGTVFQLSPSSGSWKETVLYSFTFGSDGSNPFGRLIFDGAGNLYGTTLGAGAVFQLSPGSGS